MYGKKMTSYFHFTFLVAESKPFRQFLCCEASRFPHFLYVYNQIEKYKQRWDKENVMPKTVIIKIELVGDFTDDNLQLLPKGKSAYLFSKKILRLLSSYVI